MLLLIFFSVVVGIIWIFWAYFGKISIYEISRNSTLIEKDLIVSEFPLSSSVLIRPNQSAVFEFDNLAWPRFSKYLGKIIKVYPHHSRNILLVHIKIDTENGKVNSLASKMSGKIAIVVGNASPLQLMLFNLNKIINKNAAG